MLADDRQGRGRRSGQGFHYAAMEPLLDNIYVTGGRRNLLQLILFAIIMELKSNPLYKKGIR
jgi:hypothetical protein